MYIYFPTDGAQDLIHACDRWAPVVLTDLLDMPLPVESLRPARDCMIMGSLARKITFGNFHL